MQHVRSGKVVAGRYLCPTRGLLVSLRIHLARALQPHLDARVRLYGVVDAAVVGHEAAQHLAVGSVDDAVRRKPGYVAAPHGDALGREGHAILAYGAAALGQTPTQVRVLHTQQLGIRRLGRPHVHESPQQQPLAFRVFGHRGDVCTPATPLVAERTNEPDPTRVLRHVLLHHGMPLPSSRARPLVWDARVCWGNSSKRVNFFLTCYVSQHILHVSHKRGAP